MSSATESSHQRPLGELTFPERLNFLVTNRIPRRALTLVMGWYSRIRSPALTRLSIWIWRKFADDLRLHEAASTEYASLQDCFTRTLKPDARPVCEDPAVLISPCDAVIGAHGDIAGLAVIQAKGLPYTLTELLQDEVHAQKYLDGRFMTLRLKSSMYHHFHAPLDGKVSSISYISGDVWNVNPVALKVVERLFCRNERAVIPLCTGCEKTSITLVPVAAVLVASMRFEGLDHALDLRYRGANHIPLDRQFVKGEPMGYFEHGSTVILLTSRNFSFCEGLTTGETIRMGEPLMKTLS